MKRRLHGSRRRTPGQRWAGDSGRSGPALWHRVFPCCRGMRSIGRSRNGEADLAETRNDRHIAEVEFSEAFFSSVTHWAGPLEQLVDDAYLVACQLGLAAMDALHVAAAVATGADELVTSESAVKPIHRATTVKVVGLR